MIIRAKHAREESVSLVVLIRSYEEILKKWNFGKENLPFTTPANNSCQ